MTKNIILNNVEQAKIFLENNPYKGLDEPGFDGVANRISKHFRDAFFMAVAHELDRGTELKEIVGAIGEAMGETANNAAKSFARPEKRHTIFRKVMSQAGMWEEELYNDKNTSSFKAYRNTQH